MMSESFCVRKVMNGWLLLDGLSPYNMGRDGSCVNEYVFKTLDEMNEWLKAKYEAPQAA